jgi:transcriptional regulator with XRE-family HTH domain
MKNTIDVENADTDIVLDALGGRLAERRKARGLSQGQAGEYEGTGQAYISNLENGYNRPGVVSLLARLAKRYNTSLDYLCGLTNDPTPASRRELSPSVREMRNVFEDLSPGRQDEAIALMRAMLDTQRRRESVMSGSAAQQLLNLIELQAGPDARERAVREMA